MLIRCRWSSAPAALAAAALISLFLAIRSAEPIVAARADCGLAAAGAAGRATRARWLASATLLPALAISAARMRRHRIPQRVDSSGPARSCSSADSRRSARGSRRRAAIAAAPSGIGDGARPAQCRVAARAQPHGGRTRRRGRVPAGLGRLVPQNGGRHVRADSGTGGFALVAESELPIVHDLRRTKAARRSNLSLPAGVTRSCRFRLRPGDDTSCLNLYQPKQPRILGVPDRFVKKTGFDSRASIDIGGRRRRANPWTLLGGRGRAAAGCRRSSIRRRCSTFCTPRSATSSRSTPTRRGRSICHRRVAR